MPHLILLTVITGASSRLLFICCLFVVLVATFRPAQLAKSMSSLMKYYMISANEAVNIYFVEKPEDMENSLPFKPKMTHQIFEKENIFGYTDLKVKLFYSVHSYHCYVALKYDEVWEPDRLGMTADNIIEQLRPWLREAIILEEEEFLSILATEKQKAPCGELLQEFSSALEDRKCQFVITNCNIADQGFVRVHKRFESLIIMYIDAANFIDLTDLNWRVVYLYQKEAIGNGQFNYFPIGFCTIYIFSHKKTARISQFFVIPRFQHKGLGKTLLTTVYDFLKRDTLAIRKVTVESPNEIFTEMRDKIDAIRLSDLPSFKKEAIRNGFTPDMASVARIHYKVNKKQAQKIYEILRCHYTKPGTPEYENFKNDFIKMRRLQVLGVRRIDPDESCSAAEGLLEDGNTTESFNTFLKSVDKVLKYLDEKDKRQQ